MMYKQFGYLSEQTMQTVSPKTNGKTKPTREDVARAAGVSTTAVSYAFSGKGRLPEATRQTVLRVARELGYEGNYYAQRLRSGCNNTISLFSAAHDLGVNIDKMMLVQRQLGERGYHAPLHTVNFSTESRCGELMSNLRRQKPRAIVAFAMEMDRSTREELQRYHDEGGFVVVFDQGYDCDWDQVVFDRAQNLYRAAHYLLTLGHRRIGFCEHGSAQGSKRLPGFKRALQEFEVEFNSQWVWGEYPNEEAGRQLAAKYLALQDRPTALCIVNDLAASSFVNHMLRAGVRVPEDVSVIGYDNTAAAANCIVPLTSLTHPVREITNQVVALLESRLTGAYQGGPRLVQVQGDLVVRESTRVESDLTTQS
jgi:DNA-binding LacI/PurR family transcriptional regulator